MTVLPDLDHDPGLGSPPPARPAIGIVGCGEVARTAHLPAYANLGLRVAGVFDPDPRATAALDQGEVGRIHPSLASLLADPEVGVVDIATFPEVRAPLIEAALAAGKHVLSQKPLAADLATAERLIDLADEAERALAVNQNGRWAPPWRRAGELIEAGAIGRVLSVTHLDDRDFEFIVGLPYDRVPHFVIGDYAIHWIDITRCWLDEEPSAVRAVEYRTQMQTDEGRAPWGAVVQFEYESGASAVIRQVGCSRTTDPAAHFWVHGSEGILRGRVGDAGFAGEDALELERAGERYPVALSGRWFNDGFGGSMLELLRALDEGREPGNSAPHHLRSLRMTMAACESAENEGRPTALPRTAEPTTLSRERG